MQVAEILNIFYNGIFEYHEMNELEPKARYLGKKGSIDWLYWEKSRVDNIQWHLEDLVREPEIEPAKALELKRKIDRYNQQRTNIVEAIDDWFFDQYKNVRPVEGARLNTETPAWALDRLSILQLKIWHMQIETERPDASEKHRQSCLEKLKTLYEQREDLSMAIQQLLDDLAAGRKIMRVYRQMKMYNDENLNPVLYQQKNKQ